MKILEIQKLSKTFITNKKIIPVLDEISLDIEKGDIFGVIGLSGEGKSTFVRCLNRLETADSGSIKFFDDAITLDVGLLKGVQLREYRKNVSMIFQDFNLLNQKTVYQNIEFPLTLSKGFKRTEEIDNKIKDLIKLVGLEDKEESYPSQLSGGQKQRVAIARALINNPKILLCDECTSALDPTTAEQILDLLKNLNKELGLTIVIIAHQMSVIERVCNKVAILSDHKIVEMGNVSEVFLSPQTEAAKALVYSGHVMTKLHESKLIRLEFKGNTDSPIVANIIQDCNMLVSIVFANSWVVGDKVFGQMIIKLPYYKEDIERLKNYLNIKGISYQEVNNDDLGKYTGSNL
ncbi:MAG: ATP-binding cassette domain-containing protein [Bacilli bacterium]|nr:ATP-binding cassette domain-containing protein [Bacilli bacterium]